MVTNVYLLDKLEGYNPPNFYLTIDSNAKATAIKTKFSAGKEYSNVKHSIENRYGRVLIPITTDLESIQARGYSVIYIEHNKDYKYIGLIDSFSLVSTNVMQITYTIDWFTSQVLTSYLIDATYQYTPLLPKAKVIHYRRKADGEFDYIDDGFKPTLISIEKKHISFVGQTSQYTALTVYNDSPNNQVWWIISPITYSEGTSLEVTEYPQHMWEEFLTQQGITIPTGDTNKFNPNNVLYFGYINLSRDNIPCFGTGTYRTLNWFFYIGDSASDLSNYRCTGFASANLTLNIGVAGATYTSKAYRKYKLLDTDGMEILELPEGVGVSTLDVKAVVNANLTAPGIVFKYKSNYVWQSPSFSIAFKPLLFMVDSQQVYNAEERVYAQANRSLQATNELVGGLIGAANQGAMISAFSRTQAKGLSGNAVNKGLIGGLVGAIGSVAQYGYTTLYADKEAQRIEDAYQKLKPDTLLMSGGIDYDSDMAGLYEFAYDSDTIDNIIAYQTEYGYATNEIDNNVNLNTLSGYVQADVLMDGGLNTTIQRYISDMFKYGITFNSVTIEG